MKTYIFSITLHCDFYTGLVAVCSDNIKSASHVACETLKILKGGVVAKCDHLATCDKFSLVPGDSPICEGEVVILG